MRNKFISLCLVLRLVFVMPITAFADGFSSRNRGSISVQLMDNLTNTPITGAQLSAYHVATVKLNGYGNLDYIYTTDFENCGVSLNDSSLATKLESYVDTRSISALQTVTDSQGNATFSNLPLGLYFIKQTNSVPGYAPCNAFMVTVPYKNGNDYIYNVNASPKTDVEKLTDITIKKVWNTDKSTEATDNVTVQLLRDGVVIETATLNKANGWKVTFVDMPQSDSYSVVEVNIPQGFTATYSSNGYDFTVTNSASLIDTGKLIWPIPLLAMAGIVFITTGTFILRKTGEYDE